MTIEEQDLRYALNSAKSNITHALAALDPMPFESVTREILAVLDAVDRASKALAARTK